MTLHSDRDMAWYTRRTLTTGANLFGNFQERRTYKGLDSASLF